MKKGEPKIHLYIGSGSSVCGKACVYIGPTRQINTSLLALGLFRRTYYTKRCKTCDRILKKFDRIRRL